MGLVKESLATRMPTVTEHWKDAESANVKLVGRGMDKTVLVRLIVICDFNCVSKVISRLHRFCFTMFYVWLAKVAPLSLPMRNKTKTNRDFLENVFCSWYQLCEFALSSNCFIVLFLSFRLVRVISLGLILRHHI